MSEALADDNTAAQIAGGAPLGGGLARFANPGGPIAVPFDAANGQGAPRAIAAGGPTPMVRDVDPSELTPVLKLRGLPFTTTADEIARWFNSANLQIVPITASKYALFSRFRTHRFPSKAFLDEA